MLPINLKPIIQGIDLMSQDLEKNKILAAILVAGIVAMLAGFVAKQLVHPHPLEKAVLDIDTSALEAANAGGDAAPVGPEPILGLLAKGDAKKGEMLAKACLACHSFGKGEPAKIGPNLYGIINNKQAHMDGFPYSDAIKDLGAKGGHWSYTNLNKFLWKPQSYAKGTKMTFPGFKKAEDRADVIDYLRTDADSAPALPSAAEIAADAPKEVDASKAKPGAPANGDAKAKSANPKGATTPSKPAGTDAKKTTNDSPPSAQPTAPSAVKPGVVNDVAASPAPDATSSDKK
jgi:cytochrome c